MSQADYDKHVPLGKKPTPGHGGKVCKEQAYWKENDYPRWLSFYGRKFYLNHGVSSSVQVLGCPACGIRLVPDEEPLSVPKGYEALTSRPYQGQDPIWLLVQWWQVLAIHHSQKGWIEIVRSTKEEAEEEWLRAFGERK